MLSSTFLKAFTTPVTYVLIAVLLGTAILQVRYVNRALSQYDSTQVIPIQFVTFTLSVIIGSAVLYRDFERTTADRAIKFIGGCFLTFFGVFLITSGRPPAEEEEEEDDMLSDEEGVEETIGLEEQEANAPQSPRQHRGSGARSRRSSKVSFMDAVNKPLAVLAETGVPTPRSHGGASSRPSLLPTGEAAEPAPLLRTPSREAPVHPGIQQAVSSESAVTLTSATPISEPATHPATPSQQEPPALSIPQDGSTATPRPSTSAARPRSRHVNSHIFSPSPFDSTLRGLVPSTLLKDSPRPASRRRLSRPSLRSSLYVSQDELSQPVQDGQGGSMSAIERSRTNNSFHGDSPVDGPKDKGFRNRAKSLTHTVGDLFGVKSGKKRDTAEATDEEVEGREGGSSSGSGSGRGQTSHSTESI